MLAITHRFARATTKEAPGLSSFWERGATPRDPPRCSPPRRPPGSRVRPRGALPSPAGPEAPRSSFLRLLLRLSLPGRRERVGTSESRHFPSPPRDVTGRVFPTHLPPRPPAAAPWGACPARSRRTEPAPGQGRGGPCSWGTSSSRAEAVPAPWRRERRRTHGPCVPAPPGGRFRDGTGGARGLRGRDGGGSLGGSLWEPGTVSPKKVWMRTSFSPLVLRGGSLRGSSSVSPRKEVPRGASTAKQGEPGRGACLPRLSPGQRPFSGWARVPVSFPKAWVGFTDHKVFA